MFWQETKQDEDFVTPDDIQDINFKLDCRWLPVDHAEALSEAVVAQLPWLRDEPQVGIHQIHVAESGNGWMRPEAGTDQMLCLSRRTKLTLRMPKNRLADAAQLSGAELNVAGQNMTIGANSTKKLVAASVTFCRYLVNLDGADESAFLQRAATSLKALGVPFRKAMCGREHNIETAAGQLPTRSLMIADLTPQESIRLQEMGLGEHKLMGCGLFLPHKGIDAVNHDENKG